MVRFGNRTYRHGSIIGFVFSEIDAYGAVRKPHLQLWVLTFNKRQKRDTHETK